MCAGGTGGNLPVGDHVPRYGKAAAVLDLDARVGEIAYRRARYDDVFGAVINIDGAGHIPGADIGRAPDQNRIADVDRLEPNPIHCRSRDEYPGGIEMQPFGVETGS